VGKGLHDELTGEMFVAIKTAAGHGFYLRLQPAVAEALQERDVVRVGFEGEPWLKPADRIVARFAQENGGFYDPVRHQRALEGLRHPPGGGDQPIPAERVAANVRRLERLARYRLATRLADGRWRVKDDHKLWVTSLVRPIRFHDLRHTTGSLLTMRGANLHSVQRILRHSDPRTTAGTYLHLEPGYLRREIDLLSFAPSAPAPASPAEKVAASPASAPFAAILLLGPGEGGRRLTAATRFHQQFQILTMERDIGVEPTTFSLGS
jgi:hypothetical protein